jgi:hypothetical protein
MRAAPPASHDLNSLPAADVSDKDKNSLPICVAGTGERGLDQHQRRNSVRQRRVVLRGGMGTRERRAAEEILRVPEPEERLVLSTGRSLGEGFDDSRLDALFLVSPISWKGTLAQHASGGFIGSMKAKERCGCTTT